MKTTIQFQYDDDCGHVMEIKTDEHVITLYNSEKQSFHLGDDDRYHFGDDSEIWFHYVDYTKRQSANMRIGDACMSCKITKHAYLFLKSIDLNKFIKLDVKVEFDSEDDC